MNPFARRDPWWDDGRGARRGRAQRRIVGAVIVFLAATLLALILARLPAIDTQSLVLGSGRTVMFGALLADVAACMLLVAGQMRESFRG